MTTYGALNKDTWSIIINFLEEKYWDNIRHLNTGFEKLVNSDHMFKKLPFDDLCLDGHLESLLYFMKTNEIDPDIGLYYACWGGHIEIIKLMISEGARNWTYGYIGASQGGHKEISKIMIAEGAVKDGLGLLRIKCYLKLIIYIKCYKSFEDTSHNEIDYIH